MKSPDAFFSPDTPEHTITVSAKDYTLCLYKNGIQIRQYSASCAANGMGERDGSEKTPRGMHRICEKIGNQAPVGTVFVDRLPTGEVWTPEHPARKNLILTRIIRLEGLEDGRNTGVGVDTYERYIYIHGTSREEDVGHKHFSHGCIVLKSTDLIELFDLIQEGDRVSIS